MKIKHDKNEKTKPCLLILFLVLETVVHEWTEGMREVKEGEREEDCVMRMV